MAALFCLERGTAVTTTSIGTYISTCVRVGTVRTYLLLQYIEGRELKVLPPQYRYYTYTEVGKKEKKRNPVHFLQVWTIERTTAHSLEFFFKHDPSM